MRVSPPDKWTRAPSIWTFPHRIPNLRWERITNVRIVHIVDDWEHGLIQGSFSIIRQPFSWRGEVSTQTNTARLLAVDPAAVPTHTLYTGAKIPSIGLGTFGSDKYNREQDAAAVIDAAAVGYRHFDCASVYGNERE